MGGLYQVFQPRFMKLIKVHRFCGIINEIMFYFGGGGFSLTNSSWLAGSPSSVLCTSVAGRCGK